MAQNVGRDIAQEVGKIMKHEELIKRQTARTQLILLGVDIFSYWIPSQFLKVISGKNAYVALSEKGYEWSAIDKKWRCKADSDPVTE